MICKKKKLSLVTSTDVNFLLSGDCFCSTSAEIQYSVNSHPRDRKIPSARLLVKYSYIIKHVDTQFTVIEGPNG